MKKKLIFGILTLALFWLVYQAKAQWPDDHLRITFCDVGQGDAILISYKFTQVLIDGGPDDSILACLSKNIPFWDNHIELVVATHLDADHIVGLNTALEQYQVGMVLTELQGKNSKEAQAFQERVADTVASGGIWLIPRVNQKLKLADSLDLKILWSPEVENLTETLLQDAEAVKRQKLVDDKSLNDRSIALIMHFGQFGVFLPGDLEKKGELALLEGGLIEDVDVLKSAHHGSKTSSTPEILAVLQPEVSIISSGKNNSYGHPSPEVISALESIGSDILRTDQLGTITLVSDGKTFWLE